MPCRTDILKRNVRVILDNIRSAHNVGSIFRTADGAGVEKIYLVGTTPSPCDRFGREVPEIKKTSLGATEFVEWEWITDEAVPALTDTLTQTGFYIVAVEQHKNAVSLYDFTAPEKVCYIFGNEVNGVGKDLLASADQIVEIPMRGSKESLNVSVTAGILLFKNG